MIEAQERAARLWFDMRAAAADIVTAQAGTSAAIRSLEDLDRCLATVEARTRLYARLHSGLGSVQA
jgi:hypothetical protein